MQVNFNTQQRNQNFGMAIHSNETVNKIIKSRIKTDFELKKLGEIVDKAKKNNLVDINLMASHDGKSISANIYPTSNIIGFFTSRHENFFSRNFGGGIVGFIEKCSQIADKISLKVIQAEKINSSEVFNKML